MRVIRHGREDLEIELSGVGYYLWGGFGRGEVSSVFLVLDIYKVMEGYPTSTKDLRDLPYTTRLADIDEEEKQWVRDTVCAKWKNDDLSSHLDIAFYDEEGRLLCTNDDRMNVLTILDKRLEIHMDGTIVLFKGEERNGTFVAEADSSMWIRPSDHKATAEEVDTYMKRLKRYYDGLPRKARHRIVFVDGRGKKLCSIR